MTATIIAILAALLMHIPTWLAIRNVRREIAAEDRRVRISHEVVRVPVPQRADGGVNITMKHSNIVGVV